MRNQSSTNMQAVECSALLSLAGKSFLHGFKCYLTDVIQQSERVSSVFVHILSRCVCSQVINHKIFYCQIISELRIKPFVESRILHYNLPLALHTNNKHIYILTNGVKPPFNSLHFTSQKQVKVATIAHKRTNFTFY